jgi:hypothetical protein
VSNQHKTRDIPPQVDERVQFDGALAATESRPREERQAKVDRRGIQRVCGLLELSAEAIGLVQPPRVGDENLSEVGVDAPVAVFVGIGQRAPRDRTAKARVVELLAKGAEAGLDVPQALAIGQLRGCEGFSVRGGTTIRSRSACGRLDP